MTTEATQSSPLVFKGKIVFVTGGGRGIGLAITKALAKAGATVVVTWNSRDPSAEMTQIGEEFGVSIHTYHCPGEQSAVVNEVVEAVSREVGEVNLVVANAGVCKWVDTINMSDDDFKWVMDANFSAPIYTSRAFVRHWLGLSTAVGEPSPRPAPRNLNKKIIYVSSISAIVNMTPQVQMGYNSSKAALTMATKSLAGEWAQYGITVNCISPGYVATDMTDASSTPEQREWAAKWMSMTPVNRFCDPAEIGAMITLMASDMASSFMTGHDLVMDGGYTTY